MPYPARFYPVVDSVAWVARLALLGVGTIQLRAKNLSDPDALQVVSDALEVTKGTGAKLVVNDYWRAAIAAACRAVGKEKKAEEVLRLAAQEANSAAAHLRLGDFYLERQRWAEAGLVTRDEMQTDCCYATQDKTWVHDPDGNEWEAFVVLKDNLPETAGAVSCCSTAAAPGAGACSIARA